MRHTPMSIIMLLAVLLALLFGTNPDRLPAFMLVVPFLLLFAVLVFVLAYAFQKVGYARTKSFRLGAVVALLPMTLVVMQSIGQLTVRDIVTVLALVVLTYFYISRVAVSS